MSTSVLLGQVCLLPQAFKSIKPCKFSKEDCIEHIKPLFVLSIAVIASTLYTVFDKTLLGWFFPDQKEQVAYYEYSYKIIQIPTSIIVVVGTVLFPRSCACYAKNDMEGMKKYFNLSIYFTFFIAFGAILGLIAVSDLFVVEYYGDAFAVCGNIIKCLSPIILILSLGEAIRTQYLIPMGKDMAYIIITAIIALLNIALSCILIPVIGIYGAIIGTVSAELVGTVSQTIVCRKNIDFKKMFLSMIPFVIAAGIMYGTIIFVQRWFNDSTIDLIIQIIIGGTVYVLVVIGLFLLRKDYRNNIINYVKKKLKKGNESKQEPLVEISIEESNEKKEVLENE
jgi:O-antigen/teichoic acid export membrane protein